MQAHQKVLQNIPASARGPRHSAPNPPKHAHVCAAGALQAPAHLRHNKRVALRHQAEPVRLHSRLGARHDAARLLLRHLHRTCTTHIRTCTASQHTHARTRQQRRWWCACMPFAALRGCLKGVHMPLAALVQRLEKGSIMCSAAAYAVPAMAATRLHACSFQSTSKEP